MWSACSVAGSGIAPFRHSSAEQPANSDEGSESGHEGRTSQEPGRTLVDMRTHERASLFGDHDCPNTIGIAPEMMGRGTRWPRDSGRRWHKFRV